MYFSKKNSNSRGVFALGCVFAATYTAYFPVFFKDFSLIDIVAFLHCTDEEREKQNSLMEFVIRKHRNGPLADVPLIFQRPTSTLSGKHRKIMNMYISVSMGICNFTITFCKNNVKKCTNKHYSNNTFTST